MTFHVNILSTGSQGNCIIIDNIIMLDAGITKSRVESEFHINIEKLEMVFVSHKHSDHKSIPLIKYMIESGTAVHIPLAVKEELYEKGMIDIDNKKNIHLHSNTQFSYNFQDIDYTFTLIPQKHHDIINYAIVIEKGGERLLYVTDLDTVNPTDVSPGLTHLGKFDVIIMEGNYDELWLREYITDSIEAIVGEDDPENLMNDEELGRWVSRHYKELPKDMASNLYRAKQNMRHLSKQQARAYVSNHLRKDGRYYEVHRSSMYYEKPTEWD